MSIWTVKGNSALTPSSPVTLEWKNDQGLIFTKKFEIEFQLNCKDIIEGAKAVKKFPITGIDLLQRGYSGKKQVDLESASCIVSS